MPAPRRRKILVQLVLSVPADMDDAEALSLSRDLVNIGLHDARESHDLDPDNARAARARAIRVARSSAFSS